MFRKAAFLDRDGTIIEDFSYLKDPDKISFLPRTLEALLLLKQKGYLLFVVSNQSGVGRGFIEYEEFRSVDIRFRKMVEDAGVELDGVWYCLHSPEDHCDCRKPKTGLIPRRWKEFQIDFSSSFVVGDKLSDLQLAWNLGVSGYLVLTGCGRMTLECLPPQARAVVVSDLFSLIKLIS